MAALAALAAVAGALAACDALIGLNAFHVCSGDCGATVDSGDDASDAAEATVWPDGGPEGGDGSAEGGDDASDASDALDAPSEAETAAVSGEAGPDVAPPTVTQIWVHWPMPNPDAAIAPGIDAALPNPMHYAAGDAGEPVLDLVTSLKWEPVAASATTYLDAELHCLSLAQMLGGTWRVPTRIELVSLIDFTRAPTIDLDVFAVPADAGNAGSGKYWTSSLAIPDSAPTDLHWVVSFAGGMVATDYGQWVRCVSGGS
jgi:hypothetical protein